MDSIRVGLLLALLVLGQCGDTGKEGKAQCGEALARAAQSLGAEDKRVKAVAGAEDNASAHLRLAEALLHRTGVSLSEADEHGATDAEATAAATTAAASSEREPDPAEGALSSTAAAVSLLWRALELDPALDVAKNRLLDCAAAWTTSAKQRREEGARERAVAVYERLFEREPADATPLFGLASAWHVAGESDKAAAALRRALEVAPDDDAGHRSLGTILAEQREWKGAAEALKAATRLRPAEPEYARAHGMMLANAGELQAALDELKRAVGLAPDDEQSVRTLEHLEKGIENAKSKLAAARAAQQQQQAEAGSNGDEDDAILYGDLLDGADDEEGGVAM